MIVKCLKKHPNVEEVERLGEFFRPNMIFPIDEGSVYDVYGLNVLGKEIWIDILHTSCYLIGAPLCLFEVVDGSIPASWELKKFSINVTNIWPSSFHKEEYFHDLLSDGDPKMMKILEAEVKTKSKN